MDILTIVLVNDSTVGRSKALCSSKYYSRAMHNALDEWYRLHVVPYEERRREWRCIIDHETFSVNTRHAILDRGVYGESTPELDV